MASLSQNLQSIIDALPASTPHIFISKYRQLISTNAHALDALPPHSISASPTHSASLALSASKILFGDQAITPQNSLYIDTLQKNWSSTCHLRASYFLTPQNAIEVCLALQIITHTHCRFAIRSGGHNSNPGFGSVGEEGVVLDLSGLNRVELLDEGDVVAVGPGATWDAVYEMLERNELTIVGGRVMGVGVGGLVLGGGMSHFSNAWGMVCDNVRNFEVVLADSSIVQANAVENVGLFRALKGGGPNFGIVTRFDLYTYPDYRVWYTFKVYNASDSERVMKASVEVQKAMEHDDRIGFFLSVNPGFLVAGMLYREGASFPDVFHAFDGIEPMTIAVPETNGTQLSVARAASMEGKAKRETGSATVSIDADLYVELHRILQDIAKNTSYTLTFSIQPIGPSAVVKGKEHGGNCMNIPPENQSWLAIMVQWTDDKDDDMARSQIRQLISSIESTAKSRSLLLDFHFMNDASYIQSPLKSYGDESLAFLRDESRRWDPEGVFQRLQNDGYLLDKV